MSQTILVLATFIVENSLKKVLAPTRLPKHFMETVFFLSYFIYLSTDGFKRVYQRQLEMGKAKGQAVLYECAYRSPVF